MDFIWKDKIHFVYNKIVYNYTLTHVCVVWYNKYVALNGQRNTYGIKIPKGDIVIMSLELSKKAAAVKPSSTHSNYSKSKRIKSAGKRCCRIWCRGT